MDPNRPKSARQEDLDAAKTNQPPETAATNDPRPIADSPSNPSDALSDDMPESVADNLPQPADDVADGHALSDADAPAADDVALRSEPAAYARPPLYPTMWKIDPIAAANTSAAIQSAARRPEVQELVAGTPELSTLPLLDADGQRPQETQQMFRSLFLWEAAAAEAVGDPLFTPKPTSKPRGELTKISRGPRFPDVWVDQHTWQPVLYDGEDEFRTRLAQGIPPSGPILGEAQEPATETASQPAVFSATQQPSGDASTGSDARFAAHGSVAPSTSDGGPPLTRPIIYLAVPDPVQHKIVGDALAAAAERDARTCAAISEEKVRYEFWSRDAEDRAIYGTWT